jgi:hypothetical protein
MQYPIPIRDDLEPVLRGVNLRIRGGQKLGICGRTGYVDVLSVFPGDGSDIFSTL